MPFLIDGHNLIPHIKGINLSDLDDERQCIERLHRFTRQIRSRTEVYFDHAPPGQKGKQAFGLVAVFYISRDRTADAAIMGRLADLGDEAKNWTVVSSDRDVIREAKRRQAKVLSSRKFGAWMDRLQAAQEGTVDEKWNPSLTSAEVDYWMREFGQDKS